MVAAHGHCGLGTGDAALWEELFGQRRKDPPRFRGLWVQDRFGEPKRLEGWKWIPDQGRWEKEPSKFSLLCFKRFLLCWGVLCRPSSHMPRRVPTPQVRKKWINRGRHASFPNFGGLLCNDLKHEANAPARTKKPSYPGFVPRPTRCLPSKKRLDLTVFLSPPGSAVPLRSHVRRTAKRSPRGAVGVLGRPSHSALQRGVPPAQAREDPLSQGQYISRKSFELFQLEAGQILLLCPFVGL